MATPVQLPIAGRSPARVTFDPEADAAYVRLANIGAGEAVMQIVVEGVPGPTDIVLDFGATGQLLGIEVLGATAALSPDLLSAAEPPTPPQR